MEKFKRYNAMRHFFVPFLLILLLIAVGGCNEGDLEEKDYTGNEFEVSGEETTEVPVIVYLGSDWEVGVDDTRGVPPGVSNSEDDDNGDEMGGNGPVSDPEEFKYVDEVRLFTFRRVSEDGGVTAAHDNPFRYDKSNDRILKIDNSLTPEIDDRFDDKGKHKVAKGVLKKVYGYEYRVVAVAYSSFAPSLYADSERMFDMADGDLNRFSFGSGNLTEDVTIEDFYATFAYKGKSEYKWSSFIQTEVSPSTYPLSEKAIEVPQLFWGECHAMMEDNKLDVIRFAETDRNGDSQKDLEVRGVLYRGVAKVEVHVIPKSHRELGVTHEVSWIALMADNVYTRVGLSDYDDFLRGDIPVPHVGRPSSSVYAEGSFSVIGFGNLSDKDGEEEEQVLVSYLLPCRTRLALRIKNKNMLEIRNGILRAQDCDYDVINGTGIISPDSHDGFFYLRRNHLYKIYVSDSEAFLKKFNLSPYK